VDSLIEALKHISRGEYQGVYTQNAASGEYHPQGWQPEFAQYFSI
jgi:hypothetical protein